MKENEPEVFELSDSEHVLNLEFYLHRAILKWQDALETALKQDQNIDAGLVIRGLAGDMVEGIARSKGIVHWEKMDVPEAKGKHRDLIIKNNLEAEIFQTKLDSFKKEIEALNLDKNIQNVKLSDFKVFEILRSINISATKKGTVIV